jgi:pimeloyl-ACP methyl ester carboxylesterase
MACTPGILYVTMQPSSELPLPHFHDWYNNEHGPTRLRLPFIKNGFRYRAADLETEGKGTDDMPEWMAIYDVTDIEELTRETYMRLREDGVKSKREKDVMRQIKVGRKLYDFLGERKAQAFKKLQEVGVAERNGNVLVAVSLSLKDGKDGEELDRWYDEEHIDMLSKVPGWLRTRRFVTSSILEGKEGTEYLALHEYSPENGVDGEKYRAATSTQWARDIMANLVKEKKRRVYNLYYTLGAAPRHLAGVAEFVSPDGQIRTIPKSLLYDCPAIESNVTTPDGVVLPYRLEGSPNPSAPCIVLSNSILVDWHIWDDFIASFFSLPNNKNYRILRYLTRGRLSNYGAQKITLDVLADDIMFLLDTLRIPNAAALIGVSLGGATVLNAALKYPERVAAFISCDTSSKSPKGNKSTWGDRIALAEMEGAKTPGNERIVGEQLARMTVRRWLVQESLEGDEGDMKRCSVEVMVKFNNLDGFKKGVEALFEYDLRKGMKESRVRGAFVVGAGDGVLPTTMKEMAAAYGNGTDYVVIDGAGHLPMIEKPQEFAEVATKFMDGKL